jgi:glycosyltransferase involved in cell wall biosynthesis
MRVVVVSDFAHVNGGAAAVAIDSAVGLACRGHQVSFFSAVGPVDDRLGHAGIEVICAGQHEILKDPSRLRAVRQGIWNPSVARALNLHLNGSRREDTVVHLHGWSKALSASVARAAIDRGFKIVCTLHDYFAACPAGGFFDHRSLNHCHRRALSFTCLARNCDSRNYAHKLWRITRQVVQQRVGGVPGRMDGFVSISRLSCDILRPYLPGGVPIFEVPNPIDVSRARPLEPERAKSFVMIGRLTLDKGVVLLARAAHECGVSVVFVGEGPCRQEVVAACPSATVTGWVAKERAASFIEQARALVLPSLWYEGQPLVPLEAASRGVPSVVSDGCAGRESVEDGVTGVLFKNGDVNSLKSALCRLKDDGFVHRLGRAAYERYWENPLTTERHVARLEQVYQTVLGQLH